MGTLLLTSDHVWVVLLILLLVGRFNIEVIYEGGDVAQLEEGRRVVEVGSDNGLT